MIVRGERLMSTHNGDVWLNFTKKNKNYLVTFQKLNKAQDN